MSGALLALVAACGGSDGLSPVEEAPPASAPTDTVSAPADTTGVSIPVDSLLPPPTDSSGMSGALGALDTRSALPGIAFASGDMDSQYFNTVHNGAKRGGGLTPTNILGLLADAKARGGRLMLKLCMGRDSYVKNPDGTFSFTKWKQLVDRFRGVNLKPFIDDGTIVGHFLIDEPHRTAKWGKVIPHETVEAMAKYSKDIWPTLTTFVHTKTDWLASTPITYRYLDAGWTQYAVGKGEVNTWVTNEIAAAKRKSLGLVLGMNVLAGSSANGGLKGFYPGYYAMNATQLKNFGTVILNQKYACAFFLWQHNLSYYGRSDIKAAMAALSVQAKAHPKISCQQ